MDLYDAMSTQRAIRRLKPDPIPQDVQARVFEAASWAPTGGNVQPWRMLAVRDAQLRQGLQQIYQPLWTDYIKVGRARLPSLPKAEADALERSYRAGDYLAEHMGEAPLVAVGCFNPGRMAITDSDQPRPTVVGGGSVYTAVQNLMLACRNEGLGCVLTTLMCMEEPAVKALLGIPEDWYTAAHIPIGYPIGRYGPISRRPVDKLVFEGPWPG